LAAALSARLASTLPDRLLPSPLAVNLVSALSDRLLASTPIAAARTRT
jgi:hypothetical protein